MNASPTVIVLAAGRGSRFAGPAHKLAQRVGDASVLGRALRTAVASHLPTVVVTTEPLAAEARQSVAARDVIVLPEVGAPGRGELGMGYSIGVGVAARPDAAGWLVLPGDMPNIHASTLRRIARELDHHPIAYAQYKGRRGHPVAFSAELYSELRALTGDEGARRLLARYPAHAVEVDDPGVLDDVDTVDDLERVRQAAADA